MLALYLGNTVGWTVIFLQSDQHFLVNLDEKSICGAISDILGNFYRKVLKICAKVVPTCNSYRVMMDFAPMVFIR